MAGWQDMSERELSLLDTLWTLAEHMSVIQRRLRVLTGRVYSPVEIRDAANRRRDLPINAPVLATFGPATPSSQPQPFKRVPPGTFPVPPGGYRIGRQHG